ncbi:MAG: RidA family protein [Chitinophagaceae bacterium]|nr:RidA family protein [Chitinophagaceae bacterium]
METPKSKVELLSPDGLHKNPAFSQLAIVDGPARTIYIGGQNAVDKDGNIIGKGDMEAQARQVLQNLQTALAAGNATIANIVKWNVYVIKGQQLDKAFQVFQSAMKDMKAPPLITMAFVDALGNPDYLMEIDAIAIVP